MLVARRFVVSGRVQGVGFRYFVKEVALVEHVAGWVRNRADGRVEILAEGPHAAMTRFESKVRLGPSQARVDGVDVVELAGQSLTGFRIERD